MERVEVLVATLGAETCRGQLLAKDTDLLSKARVLGAHGYGRHLDVRGLPEANVAKEGMSSLAELALGETDPGPEVVASDVGSPGLAGGARSVVSLGVGDGEACDVVGRLAKALGCETKEERHRAGTPR